LAIPIVGAGSASTYSVSASSVFQSLLVSGNTYLTARILFDNDNNHPNDTNGRINGTPGDLATTYNWTTATVGGYLYLQLANENIGGNQVPEPATFVLLGSALVGLALIGLRRRKA
jgi:hypothetical protein